MPYIILDADTGVSFTPEQGAALAWQLYGGLGISYIFAVMLFGAFIVQVLQWLMTKDEEPFVTRTIVSSVALLQVILVSTVIYQLVDVFIRNWGIVPTLLVLQWNLPTQIFVSIFNSTILQGFYLYRIWAFSKGSVLAILTPILLLPLRIAAGMATFYYMLHFGSVEQYGSDRSSKIAVGLSLSSNALIDIVIAITLAGLLERQRALTLIRPSARVLRALSKYSLGTGALTAALNVGTVIAFFASPESTTYGGLYAIAAALYGNSFMVVMNARKKHRKDLKNRVLTGEDIHLSRVAGMGNIHGSRGGGGSGSGDRAGMNGSVYPAAGGHRSGYSGDHRGLVHVEKSVLTTADDGEILSDTLNPHSK